MHGGRRYCGRAPTPPYDVCRARTFVGVEGPPRLSSGVAQATQVDKYFAEPTQDYERTLATRSRGLLKSRSAWADAKETSLIDFPLLVLVVNRVRTPQARRFQLAALEQSLVLMSGREDIARSLAKYWREERMARPDNALLQFMGAAVGHDVPSQEADEVVAPQNGALEAQWGGPHASSKRPNGCNLLRQTLEDKRPLPNPGIGLGGRPLEEPSWGICRVCKVYVRYM